MKQCVCVCVRVRVRVKIFDNFTVYLSHMETRLNDVQR